MTRKRFIKLAMSQGCSKREAIFAAEYSRLTWGCYQTAWNEMYGVISGRFYCYVGKVDMKSFIMS
ncbi:hypothetical protein MZM54_01060 [[Brevibacterium] frigoritolerans]|nr:hypothetical protein [Peribacillus frigoritolerans]